MNQKFEFYQMYQAQVGSPNLFKLYSELGKYQTVRNLPEKGLKMHVTLQSTFYFKAGLNALLNVQMVAPPSSFGIGIVTVSNDAIIIEFNPKRLTVELFIAEGKKGQAAVIYNMFINGTLDDEKQYLREKAQEILLT